MKKHLNLVHTLDTAFYKRFNHLWLIAIFALPAGTAQAAPPMTLSVTPLSTSPKVDGALDDWGNKGWQTVAVKPAMENDRKNRTGELSVQIKAGVYDQRLYIAAKWPDKKADLEYKPWEWRRTKYKRGKDRDDMFAVRFDMGGDYNECMISESDYRVDVWLWSSGRSNQVGLAEDMWHTISTQFIENAAEYEGEGGKTIYIKKGRDAGSPIYQNTRPNKKKNIGPSLPGIIMSDSPSGSLVDVQAVGKWVQGEWRLELSRALNTKQQDDVSFIPGKQLRGAIAVFNKGYSEHKSSSDTLLFDFSKIK